MNKFDRIPPKIVPDDQMPPKPLYPSKYSRIQYEGSAQQELDRMVDKWHKEKFGER